MKWLCISTRLHPCSPRDPRAAKLLWSKQKQVAVVGFQSAALRPVFLLTLILCLLVALLSGSPDAQLPGTEPCRAAPVRDGFCHHGVDGQAGSAVIFGQGDRCRCLSLRERGRRLGDICR